MSPVAFPLTLPETAPRVTVAPGEPNHGSPKCSPGREHRKSLLLKHPLVSSLAQHGGSSSHRPLGNVFVHRLHQHWACTVQLHHRLSSQRIHMVWWPAVSQSSLTWLDVPPAFEDILRVPWEALHKIIEGLREYLFCFPISKKIKRHKTTMSNTKSVSREKEPRWRLEGGSRKQASYSEILERCQRHTLQA
jgi:hypothetical protein